MADPTKCPACGTEIPEGFPEELCPNCLLKAAQDSSIALPGESGNLTTLEYETTQANGLSDESPSLMKTNRPSIIESIRYFGDYELLEEIARGGMGIVYKARQVSLNRIVAVKMILTGELASEKEIQRFHAEAEAAANLKHPNIVAIHEVGEHKGQHFFSMDYLEGQNLGQVIEKDGPMSSRKAAETLKAIAAAVQYANYRGILHRDLKPQNVLVDQTGKPYVTDFGLAKRTGINSSLTGTGAVIGSPAYMPPEQARGLHEQVGPPSEVYGLGAILYFCLTGKSPFQGDSMIAVISQVLDKEVDSPKNVNPRIADDLTTICLKCLEKRKDDRYPTAGELVEELNRFLNHEPILAKPVGQLRKTWHWLQRNPWKLFGAAATSLLAMMCLAYGIWQNHLYFIWQSNSTSLVDSGPYTRQFATFWLIVYVPLSFLLHYVGSRFRELFQLHQLTSFPGFNRIRWLYFAFGIGLIIYGISLLLGLVETGVWLVRQDPRILIMLVITLPWVLAFSWIGCYMIWEAVGTYETALFSNLVEQRVKAYLEYQKNKWSLWEITIFILGVGISWCFVTFYFIGEISKPLPLEGHIHELLLGLLGTVLYVGIILSLSKAKEIKKSSMAFVF